MGAPGVDPVDIRPARPGDGEAIARVHVDSWRAAYRDLLPVAVLDGLSAAQRTRHWDRVLLPASMDRVVVAERDGEVVGFGHVGPARDAEVVGFGHVGPARDADVDPTTGQLATIYLRPEFWGSGVGRRVHEAALAELAGLGYRHVVLWMLSTNVRAARFYRRQGWERDGGIRVQQFGGAVVIDHRLARGLPPAQIFWRPSQ